MAAVGAVLLLILKILGIVLAVLLGLLILVLLIPASVWIDYSEKGLTVKAGMLFLKFQLLPARPKKAKKKKNAAEADAGKHDAAQKKKEKKPDREKAKLTFDQIVAAVKGAGRFLKAVLDKMRITHIRILLPITGADAADTAIKYGQAQAWLHSGLAVLNRAVWLDFDECRLVPDYTGKYSDLAHCSCKISAQLIIIAIAGVKLFLLLKDEKVLDAIL
jgi:hypothetical protein